MSVIAKKTKVRKKKRTKRFNERGGVDWFFAHSFLNREGKTPAHSPEFSKFINHLYPATNDYFSPLNPTFLGQITQLELLNSSPRWMSRDGLVPLLWFFRTHPRPPKNFASTLLIHESAVDAVPDSWKHHVRAYRIDSKGDLLGNKILFAGILNESYISLPFLEKKLDQLEERLGKKKDQFEYYAYIPGRFEGFLFEQRVDFHARAVLEIVKRFGSKLRILTTREFEARDSYADFNVVELNERFLLADTYLLHFPLFRGASAWDPSQVIYKAGKNTEEVDLSVHHHVTLRSIDAVKIVPPTDGAPKELRKENFKKAQSVNRLVQAMRSEANLQYPWPDWFTEWCKTERG